MSKKFIAIVGKVFIFAGGVIAGGLIAKSFYKKKYEAIANAEIASVISSFGDSPIEVTNKKEQSKEENTTSTEPISKNPPDKASFDPQQMSKNTSRRDYCNIIKSNGYSTNTSDRPYIITPDEFGEFDEYERITLMYYQDGIIADDADNIVGNPEELIGTDALTHFGEYEQDSVHVRNDAKKCDYEVLLDVNNYADLHPERR